MKTRRYAGFTLIELLTALGIISLLAAILFPVFAQAREKARQATCVSNEHQINTAIQMYNQDYDERYPPYYDTPYFQDSSVLHAWPAILQAYSKSYAIWRCPTNPDINQNPMPETGFYWLNAYLNGWCNNRYMNACGQTPCDAVPLMLAEIPYPATTPLLGDGIGTYLTPPSMWCDIWDPIPDCYRVDRRHSGGSNYALLDGHLKWLRPDAFRSTSTDFTEFRVEQTSCWFSYPRNDGKNPWFKP